MNSELFNKVIEEQIQTNLKLMTKKGHEYSEKAVEGDGDRLQHFKKHSALLQCTQKFSIFSQLMKHIVSISDMVANNGDYPIEQWTEKITDAINYLLILKAAVVEESGEEADLDEVWIRR